MLRFDDYVYKSTVRALYGFSALWMAMIGEPDQEVSRGRRRGIQYLYYRPRVEALIDSKRAAYEHMLSFAMRRLSDERAAAFDEALTRAETCDIELDELPADMFHLIDQIKSQARVKFPATRCYIDEALTPDDVWQYVYRLGSNYLPLTKTFFDVPGSGYCLLTLRDRMPDLVTRHLLDTYGRQWQSKVRRNWEKYQEVLAKIWEEQRNVREESESL